jgi:hypothetical protein
MQVRSLHMSAAGTSGVVASRRRYRERRENEAQNFTGFPVAV